VTDSGELTSRTIGDIDLTGAAPIFSVDLDAPLLVAEPSPARAEPQPQPTDELEDRLARVERLLDADLAALGPAVVSASIAEITDRLDGLAARVDAVGARWDGAQGEVSSALDTGLEARLDRLDKRVARLTRLVEAATEPEPEGVLSPTEAALQTMALRIEQLGAEVARLVAIAERVDRGD
jgi:hypothetical protein